jgi:bifunctional non-homologous end joining protein LigD
MAGSNRGDAPTPMKATLADHLPPDDEGWAYETKWDGMRVVATVGPTGVELVSAAGNDATDRFPELAGLAGAVAAQTAVLDGEVVAFDPDGRADFGRLQPRMQRRDGGEGATPVVYVVFDLLELDGHDTTGLPYEDRRRLLTQLLEPGPSWRLTDAQVGGGQALLDAAAHAGMEGLVAKRLGSAYEPGRRSPSWRKVKVRRRQELVVGGWTAGEGARRASLGALLVGYHDDAGALRYAGRVGSGYSEVELRRWVAELAALATPDCPFEPPPPRPVERVGRWVRPELVVEVAFHEWTGEGVLRHPSYVGQRFDKDPVTVVREGP